MPKTVINVSTADEEFKQAIKAAGGDPEDLIIVDDPATRQTEFRSKRALGDGGGLLKTFAGEAGLNVVPSVVAAGTGALGAGLTGAASLSVGGASLPLAIPAGIGAALVGGIAANEGQNYLLDKFAPDIQTEAQVRRLANPRTATMGQIAGGFAAGANSLRGLLSGGVKQAAKTAAIPVTVGGGLEAYNEYKSEGEIDPLRVGAAALGGVLQMKNTKLGQKAEDIGTGLAGSIKGVKSAISTTEAPQRSNAAVSKDIMAAYNNGSLVDGSPVHKALAEELLQPDITVDQLVKVAQRHVESDLKNNPVEREKQAIGVWDAIKIKGASGDQLPQSPIEKRYAELVADGTVGSQEELVRLAKAPSLESEVNALKREKLAAAGPPPSKPGVRMTDDQVDILLKAPAEELPPNASPLDKAIFEGRRDGYVHSPEDVRRLEDAYTIGPDNLKPALRTIWEEKQALIQGPTAQNAADAFQMRDTEFFTKDFPKEIKELKAEKSGLDKAVAIINDVTAPEATKAIWRNKLESGKASLDQKWQKLLDKATSRYTEKIKPTEAPPSSAKPEDVSVKPVDAAPVQSAPLSSPAAAGPPQLGALGLGPPAKADINTPLSSGVKQVLSDAAQDVRYSGIPQPTVKAMGKAALYIPHQIVKFFRDGTVLGKERWAGTKSVIDRIKELGPSGQVVSDLDFKIKRYATAKFNTPAKLYSEAFDKLTPSETKRVNKYLNDAFDNDGVSFITLTPKEQISVDKVRRGLLYLVNTGIIEGGPGVREGGMYRDQRINPNYIPSIMEGTIRDIIAKNKEGHKQLRADWEAWYANKLGLSPDESSKMLSEYLDATGSASLNDAAKFGALTKAEGVGLPPSFRADPRKALMYHAYRASKNLAWYKYVQKDPAAAKVVGETDDGWGGAIDSSNIALESLAGNDSLKSWKRETNSHLIADDSIVNSLNRIATTFQLGPMTGARDLLATPAHLMELLDVHEVPLIAKALNNIMTADVRGDMEKSGAIKNKSAQPFEFNTATFTEGTLDRVLEAVRGKTGRNLLESTARQWAYEIGRLAGAGRLSKGDMGFFQKLDIPEYRSMKPEDLLEATGAKFVEMAQGNYGASGLPAYLLNSSNQKSLRMALSLQRWGVERFNNWYKNAWQPAAEQGDFGPLLKSAFGGLVAGSALNVLKEVLTDQKPQEMTWKEFMGAENKELAYTLFSKLQNAGFAGLFSQMGMAGVQLASGETPNGINNLGFDLINKAWTRGTQLSDAIQNRGAGGFDLLGDFADTVAKDHIQLWRLLRPAKDVNLGNREERMYNRQMGKGNISSGAASIQANPMDPMADLRQATSIAEIQKALPSAGRAIERNPTLEPRFQSSMRPLVGKSGQPSYYDFVGQLQGAAAGQAALQRDLQQKQLGALKQQQVQQMKWKSQITGGPQ